MKEAFSPYLRLIQQTGTTTHPGGLAMTDVILSRVNLKKDSKVLDVGCGAGHAAAHIAKNYGCIVVGVDISPEAIERASALYQKEPFYPRLSFMVADARNLKGAIIESFDLVLCESVLIFIEDKKQALLEMEQLVKPNGFIALNELCVSAGKDSQEVRDFFARPEMGCFLTQAKILSSCFFDSLWNLIIVDEHPFDMKAQLKADFHQWANFKGALQILESSYQLLFDKNLQHDLMSVIRLATKIPTNLFEHLNVFLVLAKKH